MRRRVTSRGCLVDPSIGCGVSGAFPARKHVGASGVAKEKVYKRTAQEHKGSRGRAEKTVLLCWLEVVVCIGIYRLLVLLHRSHLGLQERWWTTIEVEDPGKPQAAALAMVG